jgi:energy-converting hydrogenase Eha subunit G
MMFLGSIVTATILIVAISFYMRRADESGIEDLRRVRAFVGVEYAFFLLGVVCFACRMLEAWLASATA